MGPRSHPLFLMRYIPFLFVLPLLVSCGAKSTVDINPENLPVYCIRSVVINEDNTILLDMPGYPYGMNDEPLLVQNMDRLENVTNCTPDDPRML